ncbi:hypothetical protein CASFOL_034286 [Castilleja foliolosa]|uniref:Replication factor A C-terminal domain-containing protein n=1 Tax=Castilleja foliolosa TaxID=1961234 RepID=A0ABD3BWA0_9LAMI
MSTAGSGSLARPNPQTSNNKSLEIVFHDSEGGRITGIVKFINLKLLDSRFTQGRVYAIKGYYVENNMGKFLSTLAKYRIIINAKSLVIEMPEESYFPDFMFDFRNFVTLVDPDKVDETLLFDVIGKVTEIHNPQEKTFSGRRARLIEIVIEDLSGRQLNCTLWGNYVDEILAFEGNLKAGPPVLILQLCRAKVYRDKVTLSNSFDVTQIHTLETLPAIEAFRSQIKEDDLEPSKSISRGSLSSTRAEYDDLMNGRLTCNPVDLIYTVDSGATFWVCAIIGNGIGNWCYLACTKCSKKLDPVGVEYLCNGCQKSFKTGVYRYKLKLEVLDSTANASLLCWDREAEKLVGRPCRDIRLEYIENLKSEKDELPYDLQCLVDKTVMFKVTVKDDEIHTDNGVFTVNRIVKDPLLVAKYNHLTLETETEADFLSLMMNEEKACGENSEDEVTVGIMS